MTGNKPTATTLLPEPGQDLKDFFPSPHLGSRSTWEGNYDLTGDSNEYRGLFGLIWEIGRHYKQWRAQCQRCGHTWKARHGRGFRSPVRMPQRCPGCHSRGWHKPPFNETVLSGHPDLEAST